MKLIALSSPTHVPNEHEIINSLFEEGLEIFHIHKPNFSKEETEIFIRQTPAKYHNKIFLHSDFPKFHSLQELHDSPPEGGSWRGAAYAFLSPIFNSISKEGYKSSHEFHELTRKKLVKISVISGKNIIALSGIDEDKIELCHELGFAGVAVLGAIWKNANPIEKFKRIQKQIMNIEQGTSNNEIEILRHS